MFSCQPPWRTHGPNRPEKDSTVSSLLVTLVFLLADGTAARSAYVSCSGIAMFEAGNDFEDNAAPEGSRLLLDARGATVLIAPRPSTIDCWATQDGQRFSGAINLKRNGQVTAVRLK
jgi:hypothetical protein